MNKSFCKAAGVMSLVTLALTGSVNAADQTTVMTLGTSDPPEIYVSNDYTMGVVFKGLVERWSKGAIEVELHPGGELGSSREMLEGVQLGSIQGNISGSGPLSHFFKPMAVFSIPYLIPSADVAWDILDGPFGDDLKAGIREQTGMRVIGIAENGGFRHFTNNVRPLTSPADFEGLKMRTMQVPSDMIAVEALGAAPTPVNWKELYTALKTGVADGQENGISVMRSIHINDVQKYLTLDGHKYDPEFFVVNDTWFNSLPAAHQDIILRAGEISATVGRGVTQTQGVVGLEHLQNEGMEVYVLSPEEKQMFRDAAQEPAKLAIAEQVGDEWVNKIVEATAVALAK